MVLERLVSSSMLEKHFQYSILLGAGYSLIGMILSSFIFGANAGIVSVVFASLFLAPSMRSLFRREEQLEEKEKTFTVKRLIADNLHILKAYAGVFIGVFLAYFLASLLLPWFGVNIIDLLREQLFLDPAVAGRATYQSGLLINILVNNWLVIVVTFVLALLIGDGAVFFVAWNASAWGAIFGFRALAASQVAGVNPAYYAGVLLLIVMWHVILEGGAYVLAAISGSVISSDVIKQSDELHRFLAYGAAGMVLYVLLFKLAQSLSSVQSMMILIPVLLFGLYLLSYTFTNKKHREVYTYNFWLFVGAILVFIVGAALETAVLSYSDTLSTIYAQAAMFR